MMTVWPCLHHSDSCDRLSASYFFPIELIFGSIFRITPQKIFFNNSVGCYTEVAAAGKCQKKESETATHGCFYRGATHSIAQCHSHSHVTVTRAQAAHGTVGVRYACHTGPRDALRYTVQARYGDSWVTATHCCAAARTPTPIVPPPPML